MKTVRTMSKDYDLIEDLVEEYCAHDAAANLIWHRIESSEVLSFLNRNKIYVCDEFGFIEVDLYFEEVLEWLIAKKNAKYCGQCEQCEKDKNQ